MHEKGVRGRLRGCRWGDSKPMPVMLPFVVAVLPLGRPTLAYYVP